MNTTEFIPSANINSINTEADALINDIRDNGDVGIGTTTPPDKYEDKLTEAYKRLQEMYLYNYDTIVDTDYDEMHKVHYYEWLHKFDR